MKYKRKMPVLPEGVKINFQYFTNEYINLVSVNKTTIVFYLWDGVSQNISHILSFPRR